MPKQKSWIIHCVYISGLNFGLSQGHCCVVEAGTCASTVEHRSGRCIAPLYRVHQDHKAGWGRGRSHCIQYSTKCTKYSTPSYEMPPPPFICKISKLQITF